MGFWRGLREFFTTPPVATFDSPAKPIDQVILRMLNTAGTTIGRPEALSVPAVQRGRNMLASISTLPLVQIGPTGQQVANPLLRQFDLDVPNVVHLAQTVEDLLFDAIAWWEIVASDFDDFPVNVQRREPKSVSLVPPNSARSQAPLPSGEDPRGAVVWVDGKPVAASRMIRFDSPNPGILQHCGRTIRRAIALELAAKLYADDPRPLDYFTPADGADEPEDDEITQFLNDWSSYRKQRATAYVPRWATYNDVDAPSPQELQLVELQKQVWLELSQMLGVDAEELGVSTTSRTYFNGVDRKQSKVNEVLAPYMKAITDRLSMGDVTRRGHRVQFDLTDYLKGDPQTRIAYYEGLKRLGAITPEEIRDAEGLGPMPQGAAPEPTTPEPAGGGGASPAPEMVDAAREPAHTFDGDELTFANVPVTGFSVDVGRRTIEGTIMPYGAVGTKHGIRFRFAKGALKWTDPNRVKLNVMHDSAQSVGYAQSLKLVGTRLHARFKVARGPEGDRALRMAEDKVWDGFSVGVDFSQDYDAVPDPQDKTGLGLLVRRADLRHVGITPEPVFDDARVTGVAASRTSEGNAMEECATCGQRHAPGAACPTTEPTNQPNPESTGLSLSQEQVQLLLTRPGALQTLLRQQPPPPQPEGLVLSSDQIDTLIQSGGLRTLLGLPASDAPQDAQPTETRQRVNPTRRTVNASVEEPAPYRFDRKGNLTRGSHDFSSDLFTAFLESDKAAYDRALSFVRAEFDVVTTNVAGVNPNIQRPDLYVDQRDFRYPIWDAVNKGTLTEIIPFVFPKFSSAGSLVGAHTEGTEPSSGTFVVTTQTVTPTATSGKAKISREVFDAGGNPQVSDLIWRQMVRGWYEALEAAIVATLDAASPTSLGTFTVAGGTNGQTLVSELEAALALLQFVRGGFSMTDMYTQIDLYKALVSARDSSLRPYFAAIGPQNARGTTESRFGALDVNGVTAYPAWALAATGTVPASSYLFDRASVHGWASAPNRLDINMTEVANVYIGVWGYKATAISDINGVREVIYDPSTLA